MVDTKSNSIRRRIVAVVLALFLLPTVSATGKPGNGHREHAEFGRPGSTAQVSRTINIELAEFRFKPSRILIKKGETIRFWLHNRGKLMHELVIGTTAYHANRQKELATKLGQDTRPFRTGDAEKLAVNNGAILEPGDLREFLWSFTEDTELKFGCNFPGHYNSGMVGIVSIR